MTFAPLLIGLAPTFWVGSWASGGPGVILLPLAHFQMRVGALAVECRQKPGVWLVLLSDVHDLQKYRGGTVVKCIFTDEHLTVALCQLGKGYGLLQRLAPHSSSQARQQRSA
jgi:hypothetical protein